MTFPDDLILSLSFFGGQEIPNEGSKMKTLGKIMTVIKINYINLL